MSILNEGRDRDDGVWDEIMLGEQVRGRSLSRVSGDDLEEAYAVLGAAVAARNPAALAAARRAVPARRPKVKVESFDYTIDFGPASGAASTTTTLSFIPQMHFRVEKVMATDTSAIGGITVGAPAGYGTRVQSIYIGADFQKAANTGATLTAFYNWNALGNGVRWRVCKAALTMSVTISFINLCTFDMSVFGQAVRPG